MVANAAHVSQSDRVSCRTRDVLDRVSAIQLDQIAAVLDVSIFLDAEWNGGIVDRLIDRAHASIVEAVVRELRDLGWEVVVEFGFNHYGGPRIGRCAGVALGERGRSSIVEVKSILTDLQSTFTSLATKMRVVPMLARRDLGWDVRSVSRLIVLPGSTGEPRNRGPPRGDLRRGAPGPHAAIGSGSGDRTARSRGSGSCHHMPTGTAHERRCRVRKGHHAAATPLACARAQRSASRDRG